MASERGRIVAKPLQIGVVLAVGWWFVGFEVGGHEKPAGLAAGLWGMKLD